MKDVDEARVIALTHEAGRVDGCRRLQCAGWVRVVAERIDDRPSAAAGAEPGGGGTQECFGCMCRRGRVEDGQPVMMQRVIASREQSGILRRRAAPVRRRVRFVPDDDGVRIRNKCQR